MAAAAFTARGSTDDHDAGDWYSVPELRLREHRFTVPLDYSIDHSAASHKISIFAREVVTVGKEEQPLPYLLYLQGGPGFECSPPTESSGWIQKACEEFRVILMDQRGTGLSTPLTVSSMSQFKTANDLVYYLKHFRADSIVKDAEFIRVRMVPDAGPWTILGQSFGGFCAVTYLSFAPKGLKQVLITGGIPPIGDGCTADAVYKAGLEQIKNQNEKYYKRFPQDEEIIREVVNYLAEKEGGVILPSGGILTPKGLQTLGLSSLGSGAGFERLHYMFERVWDPVLVPGAPKQISYYFLHSFEKCLAFDTNPLYALLHESIYCQGASSRWSAHRMRSNNDEKFDAIKAAREGRTVFFMGEMIFPWMFDEIHSLKQYKEAAQILSEKKDWPPLYDISVLKNNKFFLSSTSPYAPARSNRETYTLCNNAGISSFKVKGHEQTALNFKRFHQLPFINPEGVELVQLAECNHVFYGYSMCQVPVAAAVYYEDMYVNFKLAMETASQIAGIRTWVTNEFMHSGLRDAGSRVFDHLMGMLKGRKPLF